MDGELAGYIEYSQVGQVYRIIHTELFPQFQGQGVSGVLTSCALDDIRASGALVVPVCPFTQKYLEKHPEYADLITTE